MKNKLVAVRLEKNRVVSFFRLQSNCKSHRIENGGNGWCKMVGYKVRPYWYIRLKMIEDLLPTF